MAMRRRFDDDRLGRDDSAPAAGPAQPAASRSHVDILALQRSAGNHAVSEMIAGGLNPNARRPAPGQEEQADEEVVGGRTAGEVIGDTAGQVTQGAGNMLGGAMALLTGIDITTSDVVAPTWNNHGSFTWDVGFNTTGTNGWIVQEIVNTYRATNSAGASVVPRHTPRYWEAWKVDAAGTVSPSVGAINDMWRRPSRGNNTKGHWSMQGKVYFTTTDPALSGLTPGGVPDAGILLSGTTEPADLGIARLHRHAHGTWDSTVATPVHTGSAG